MKRSFYFAYIDYSQKMIYTCSNVDNRQKGVLEVSGIMKKTPLFPTGDVTHEEHRKLFFYLFNQVVKPDSLIRVELDDNDMSYAKDFAERIVKEKMKEKVHQFDGNNEIPRWVVGTLGEVALGKHLGMKIHDDSIGDTKDFTVPDLFAPLGLMCGVKTFRIGNFPLTNRIRKKNGLSAQSYPQIFISVDIHNQCAFIHGLASVETLLKNEADLTNNRFVKDKTALKRKTAFTHLSALEPFSDLSSLKELMNGSTHTHRMLN